MPDLVSWNSIIGAYSNAGLVDEAIVLFLEMRWLILKPDDITVRVELKTKEAKSNISLNLNTSRLTFGFDPSKAKQLSWHPRVFLYEGFLSDEECDHLVSLAHDKLEKSLIRDETPERVRGAAEAVYDLYYVITHNLLTSNFREEFDMLLARARNRGRLFSTIFWPNDPELVKRLHLLFTRGDAVQTINMNRDNYLEEAMKMRNLLDEFRANHGLRPPTILGVREHVFTGSVSSLAWFVSNQETSFVTLGQHVLAYPLKIFHITRGGNIERGKAYKVILHIKSFDSVKLSVSLLSSDGRQNLAMHNIIAESSELSNLTKIEFLLKSNGTNANSRLQLTTTKSGTIWLDQVSVMPLDTYKDIA
uniref:Glycosyl transferase 48 domain-containing protein n=1 Tax=Ananas comosus var. bracteatus TaxID=296719 RepID=A0A6V7Q8W1_ANACO|nr:unnamed protein product [Ananas comosus var. bracteatus]